MNMDSASIETGQLRVPKRKLFIGHARTNLAKVKDEKYGMVSIIYFAYFRKYGSRKTVITAHNRN